MPRFADLLANLHYTAFPVLFPTIVRVYTNLFGATDFALRGFAFLIGAGFIAAAWFYSLSASRQPPLLALGLIGLNSNFLTEGMAIRGYGLSAVLLIVTITLTVRLIDRISVPCFVAMSLVFLASTQCVFFNGAFAPAILLAAIAVFVLHRRFKIALLMACLGLIIALAYVPYILNIYFHVRPWVILIQEPAPVAKLWGFLMEAFGKPTSIMRWVWSGIVLGATGLAIWRLKSIWNRKGSAERDRLLFAVIILFVSIPSFSLFVWIAHTPLLQRYYVVLFCLLAVASDLILANLCRHFWLRVARGVAVMLAIIALPVVLWPVVTLRDTNIDILAKTLEKESGTQDVIIVNSWSRGISFNRYYHGHTRWLTVPNIEDHRTHRYDLFKTKMMEFFPLDDAKQAMSAALKSGNRVWVVNDFRVPLRAGRPMVLAPAPDPVYGWSSTIYSSAWAQDLTFFLQRHIRKSTVIAKPETSVNRQENASLIVLEGWEY